MGSEENELHPLLADYERDREAWNLPLPREISEPARRRPDVADVLGSEVADDDADLEPAA